MPDPERSTQAGLPGAVGKVQVRGTETAVEALKIRADAAQQIGPFMPIGAAGPRKHLQFTAHAVQLVAEIDPIKACGSVGSISYQSAEVHPDGDLRVHRETDGELTPEADVVALGLGDGSRPCGGIGLAPEVTCWKPQIEADAKVGLLGLKSGG